MQKFTNTFSSLQIIRAFYTISGLYTLSASLIWGVNTLFLLDAGLNIFQVFLVNAIFSIGMTVFELPTGVLADTRGRRTSFLLSTLVLAAGTLGYVLTAQVPGNVLGLAVTSVIMGLGYTFYSGAVEAWLVDALKATGYTGILDQVFSRSALISGGAMLVGTVGGGILGDINLAIPYILRAILLVLLFIFAYFTMHELGYQPRAVSLKTIPAEMKKIAQASVRYGWQQPGLRLLMLANFLQVGFMFWAFYAWPPYLLALYGEDAVWLSGVVTALISLATMAGNALVDRFSRMCGRRTTLLLGAAAVATAASAGIGLAGSFWAVAALLLLYNAALGVLTPVQQAYLHALTPSEQRAAIVSFNSMIGNGGGILGQSGLGYLAQVRSIPFGYITGGLATIFVLPLYFAMRRLNQNADHFSGSAAAQPAPAGSAAEQVAHGESD